MKVRKGISSLCRMGCMYLYRGRVAVGVFCLMVSALSIHSGGRLAVYSCYGTFIAETDMFSNTVFMQA